MAFMLCPAFARLLRPLADEVGWMGAAAAFIASVTAVEVTLPVI